MSKKRKFINDAKNFSRVVKTRWYLRHRRKIEAILRDGTPPDTRETDRNFDAIQNRTPARRFVYGYSPLECWTRASERVAELLKLDCLQEPGAKTLEVGCGDGLVSLQLSAFGHDVACTDLEDWRSEQCSHLPSHIGKMEDGLPYEDNEFDCAFSYNTFEHVEQPDQCLAEMSRVVRPGGLILISFSPLYCSPWGLHAYRTINAPYAQFLFSENTIIEKLREIGHRDLGRESMELQPLNKWRIESFSETFGAAPQTRIHTLVRTYDFLHLDWVLRFPQVFTGQELELDDITVAGISCILRRCK
ncbi:class I SAM-dependent methyltransferase [Crateriforma spongiae]|uniref:class I SAM-dependent methyltransferase n=1 Tax=Crateriforma spongiae TaxID=2724528 RepID=UPI0014455D9A|nr:class I SAM-dependent methyltransferase [Crateriforma spongiae]